jgi:hypothetical protein
MLIALQIALHGFITQRDKARREDERKARIARRRELAGGGADSVPA